MSENIQQISSKCHFENITLDNVEFEDSYKKFCNWITKCENDENFKNKNLQKYIFWSKIVTSKEIFLDYIQTIKNRFNNIQSECDYVNFKNYKINRNGVINDIKSSIIQLLNIEEKGYNIYNSN